MSDTDDFMKEIEASLEEAKQKEQQEKLFFSPTKTVNLYIDYDEWGFGSIMATTSSIDTVNHFGGFNGHIVLQWCQERNTYRLPSWDMIFHAVETGFCELIAFIAKETGMTLASSLFAITNILRHDGIPFPSIEGTPLEWIIIQDYEWEEKVISWLADSQLISRNESTQ